MGFGVAWIDIFRPPKPILCFSELIGIERDDAEVVEGALVLLIAREDGAIK